MGGLTTVLSIALAAHVVSVDQYPLREGCDPEEPVIAQLNAGDPVQVRFALAGAGAAGTCYKVSVESGGKALQGYVSADGITGTEAFDQARRAAPQAALPAMLKADAAEIQQAAIARGSNDPGARAARLIEANRPNEALMVLEKTIRSGPEDAGLLSLAGYAAYRGDDMRRAIDYWGRSLALRPSASVQRLYAKAQRELKEDKSAERLVGSRFLLRYNRQTMSAATAREIIAALDREFARVSQELGCRADERIVAIVQTPEEYRRTTQAAEWSGGQYTGRIRVAATNQTQFDARTRQIFAHEIVHACMAGLGNFPVWLHEGLAQKLSGERLSERDKSRVQRMARAGQLPRLDNLSQTWARMSAEHASVAYATALAAVELFYRHHRGVGPRNLLRNPHLLQAIQADLDRRLRTAEIAQLR